MRTNLWKGVVTRCATPFSLSVLALLTFGVACTDKPTFVEYPNDLGYSSDSVHFDSVFVGRTSPTRVLSIHNRTEQSVSIPRIGLLKGGASPYVALIDGEPGPSVEGLHIESHDSLLVFIRFRTDIALNDTVSPCTDSLLVEAVSGTKYIPLTAWTLNAKVLDLEEISSDLTIDGPPARVLKRSLRVAEGVTLTLRNGAALYFPPRARLEVCGTLRLEGQAGHLVLLAPDRLDQYYRTQHGLWGGVTVRPKTGRLEMRHAIIRNAATALTVQDYAYPPLRIEHSQLLYYALDGLALTNSTAEVAYSIIAQGARNAIRLRNSHAKVTQSTLYAVLPDMQTRRGPLLSIERPNRAEGNSLAVQNCVLWGDREQEIEMTQLDYESQEIVFAHSLVKVAAQDTLKQGMWRIIRITQPELVAPRAGKFGLKKSSPARGLGSATAIPAGSKDLLGRLYFPSVGHADRVDAGALVFRPESR